MGDLSLDEQALQSQLDKLDEQEAQSIEATEQDRLRQTASTTASVADDSVADEIEDEEIIVKEKKKRQVAQNSQSASASPQQVSELPGDDDVEEEDIKEQEEDSEAISELVDPLVQVALSGKGGKGSGIALPEDSLDAFMK
ncbi:hypothetical protein CYMTET_32761 [Cymbomonas tetramitiformis]|uniref:Uncharacterized protein n=1 Tax=Cymbomonas tetramitiformis TaxID=36881 RepID=A0AAE0KRX0_9CHLO|nr:hypothetical protein CYMTET_32761 [Cymbomonas tetramitiformis]|eukprot:gene16811-19973_t